MESLVFESVGLGPAYFQLCQWWFRSFAFAFCFCQEIETFDYGNGEKSRGLQRTQFPSGGSTFAFSLNMPLLYVKSRGDWKSNCVERYINIDRNQSMNAAALLAEGAAVM